MLITAANSISFTSSRAVCYEILVSHFIPTCRNTHPTSLLAEICLFNMILISNTIFWTPILGYFFLNRPFLNSKLTPDVKVNESQEERKLILISGEMYNHNCNLSLVMLALAVRAVQTGFNLKKIYVHHGSCTLLLQ